MRIQSGHLDIALKCQETLAQDGTLVSRARALVFERVHDRRPRGISDFSIGTPSVVSSITLEVPPRRGVGILPQRRTLIRGGFPCHVALVKPRRNPASSVVVSRRASKSASVCFTSIRRSLPAP